ncbi:hypothetical protein NEUTE2DRAFT_134930 [Neurospora tetrasperma FGSC 2509]|nr:hypothetical protein NEUTE2DRAFT_134930 [Neurospora tetrasperma FGSC 2509]
MPETLQILKHSGIYYRIALFAVSPNLEFTPSTSTKAQSSMDLGIGGIDKDFDIELLVLTPSTSTKAQSSMKGQSQVSHSPPYRSKLLTKTRKLFEIKAPSSSQPQYNF